MGPAQRALSIVFVYLSIDELTALHEQTIAPLREPLVSCWSPSPPCWPCSSPAGTGPSPVAARLIVVSGRLYVGGAAGVEVVGGLLTSRGLADTMLYPGAVALEEGLEMVGALLMLSTVTWLGGTRGRPPAPAMTGIPPTGLLD